MVEMEMAAVRQSASSLMELHSLPLGILVNPGHTGLAPAGSSAFSVSSPAPTCAGGLPNRRHGRLGAAVPTRGMARLGVDR